MLVSVITNKLCECVYNHVAHTDVVYIVDEYMLLCWGVSIHCGLAGTRSGCLGLHSCLVCSHRGCGNTKWLCVFIQ